MTEFVEIDDQNEPVPFKPTNSSGLLAPSAPKSWGTLTQLPHLLPRAPTMSENLLPASLCTWVIDIAERLQVPMECIAIPAMIGVAGVVGRSCGILPKKHDDWLVVPNLWGGIVARPGFMKTASLTEAFKPIHVLIGDARKVFEDQDTVAAADEAILKAQMSAATDRAKQNAKEQKDLTGAKNDLIALQKQLDENRPHERRYIVSDSTIEKVAELLKANPRGLIQSRDELTGFLRNLDKPGREGDREFYLESWNGTGSFQVDRIGRGSLHIDALCLSIIGGIQPQKLRKYISAALAGEGGDGLLQRFQLLVWPEFDTQWRDVDRSPNLDEREHVTLIFRALDQLSVTQLELDPENYRGGVPALRFAPEAQALFTEWRTALEIRLHSSALENTPAFESYLAKNRSLMPSLALLFHLVDHATADMIPHVSLEAAQMAAAWTEFLEGHARKVYAGELSRNLAAAHSLIEHIRGGDVVDGTSARDIYRHHWSGLNDVETLWAGLRELEKYGAVQIVQVSDTGGRPTDSIYFHPNLVAAA